MTLDNMVNSVFPVLTAPIECSLPEPTCDGVRYVLARNGIWQDIESNWIRIRQRIGSAPLPFGKVSSSVQLKCSFPSINLWREFVKEAHKLFPNEVAALFVWNAVSGDWRMAMRKAISSSQEHIDYENPDISPDEVAIIDVHSHGELNAFFSSIDDMDDAGSLKISAVLGCLHDEPELLIRFNAIDRKYKMELENDGALKFIGGFDETSYSS